MGDRIVMASDHRGAPLKAALRSRLEQAGHPVEDVGTDGTDYMRIKHSHVDLDTTVAGADLHFRLGLQPYRAARGMLFDDDFAGMILSHETDNANYQLIWMKVFEGATLAGEYEEDLEDLDVNFAGIAGANDQVRVKGSWFLSEGDDFITQDVDIAAGTTQNINIPNARLTGFEVDGEYQFLPVTVKLGLSYVKAENRDTGEYLSNNVPLTLVADLSYRAEAIASIFGVRGRFARANNRVGDNDATTAGYSVYDVYYRWTPDWPHLETLTLDLAVSNITDKSYAKRFASLKEEGRSYNVRLAYKW